MRVLITENKFQKTLQNQIDKILDYIREQVEINPKQFRSSVVNNIDDVVYIKVMEFEKKPPVTQPDRFVFVLRCEVEISSIIRFSLDPIYEQIELELRQIFGRDFFFILVTQKLIKPDEI
jgi:hypothetical protein